MLGGEGAVEATMNGCLSDPAGSTTVQIQTGHSGFFFFFTQERKDKSLYKKHPMLN